VIWIRTWSVFLTISAAVAAPDIAVHPGSAHLRSGDTREWSSFPQTAHGKTLSIRFDAPEPNAEEHSLILRQRDVKNRTWRVRVNGATIGVLLEDERRMICILPIAAKLLRGGSNTLEIESVGGAVSDDIEVSDIRVRSQSVASLMRESAVSVTVAPSMPVRITVVDPLGYLIPDNCRALDRCCTHGRRLYARRQHANPTSRRPVSRLRLPRSRVQRTFCDSAPRGRRICWTAAWNQARSLCSWVRVR
jgi:hypothetical protein